MPVDRRIPWMALVGALLLAGPAAAQEDTTPDDVEVAPAPSTFDVVRYTGGGRDPFVPLTDQRASGQEGPRFQELTLTGVFAGAPGSSLAVLEDPKGRGHFLRVGQSIGDATLIEILPGGAVFEVNEYGAIRREILRLEQGDRREGGEE